jgi:hypothetical protein
MTTSFTTFATATFASGNIVVVQSAENMVPGLPIVFSGNTFGNVTANATYYIGNITFGFPTSNITLTSLPGGATYALANGSGNMIATFTQGGQQIISTVPPGEPLNQAFDAINTNFDQIWAAGPVGSNIQIDQNTIYTLNTNGNLVLNPNGIGNVIANAHVIPDQDRVRNLGAFSLRWNTVYAQNFVGNIAGNVVAGGSNGQIQFNNDGILGGANGFTYNTTTNAVSISGNLTAANVGAANIVASGTAYLYNISSGGVSSLTTIQAATLSATGNITGNYFFGNGSQLTGITADNVNADDLIGNLLSGNVLYSNLITVGNLVSLSVTGNTTTGNLSTTGYVSAVGNISGNYILGNGALLTGVITSVANINNGNSNVTISGPGSNVTVGVGGTSNVMVVSPTDVTITGNLTVTGNATLSGNILGDRIQNGNTQIDIQTPGGNANVSVGGVANVAIFADTGLFVNGINSVSGNITGGNVLTGGTVSAVGNITGNYFIGNGSQLTGITADNVNADDLIGNTLSGNVLFSSLTTVGNLVDLSVVGTTTTGNLITAGYVSVVGNIISNSNVTGGNLLTSGTVSAVSNVTGGNVLTGGIISATSTIQGGNILTSGDVSATGPVTGGNIYTGGVVSAVGTVTGGNLATAGTITATGTVTGGNVVTAGYVSATSDVTGGNISTAGNITGANVIGNNGFFGNVNLTGNITANSLTSNSFVSATGTGTFGNIATAGTVSATGNVTGNYFIGNGALLTGIDTTLISNGNTNVQTYANGNVSVTVAGVANTVVFTVTGVDVTGSVSASGNITGGNIATAGAVSATGNVTGGNVNTSTVWSNSDLNLQPVGNVSLGNRYVTGVRYPSADQDAASKIYVDNLVSTAISYHEAVYVATTTTLVATTGGTITYNQPGGAGNGIGATLTTTGSFNLIDTGNVQTAGTRILVKNEANATHNGVYVWSNATVITRASDADTAGVGNAFALGLNDYFFVTNGNVNLGSAWIVDAPTSAIVFGTSNIEFAQFSQSQVYSANTSAGLSLTGTVFSAKVDNNTTAFDLGGNIIVKASANLTTPNIGAATGTSLSVTGNVEGGNIVTVGYVTATGNVTGGNIVTAGNITATGNIAGNYFIGNGSQLTGVIAASVDAANLTGNTLSSNVLFSSLTTVGTLTSLSVSGNVDGGNIHTAGTVSATGTVVGGNIATAGSVTATGDVTGGNILTAGYVTATGTGTFGNVLTGGVVSATSSLLGGNVLTPGDVSAGGSLTGGNIFTGGQISAVSTVTGGNIATTGYVTATGNITGGNIISAGQISSTGNITAPTFVGNLEATIVSASGNVTGGNLATAGTITATGNITGGNLLFGSGVVSGTGNIYANKIFANIQGNVDAATLSASGNINGGNLLIAGTISSVGNVTAPTFIGNLIGNITGNIDAGGSNTQIQFNDADILAGSPGFTFDKTSNLVTITGNVTAGNVASLGIVTANLGVYGDIYTTSIDSADSSAIIVTPDMILLSGLNVNQDITVGNIIIPSYGNITVGNVRIANLATPVFDQDAVTKQYVDSAIGNVLPIITNQTIDPDGSSLTYTLDQNTTAVGVLVTINGISQTPGDSYTVAGNAITFAETLLTSDIVQVRFLSGTSSGGGGGTNYANANVVAYAESGWAGNIIPQGNLVYNLGNSTNRWNDLYLSGNTIYLDSATIGATGTGVTFSGNITTGATVSATGNITGGNLISSATIYGNVDVVLGDRANASAAKTRIVSFAANSYIQTGNGTSGTTGNIIFSPYSDATSRVSIDTASGNLSAVGNITAQNFIGNISITGNVTGTSANVDLVAGGNTWSFNNTGNLVLPGNTFSVNYANSTPVNVVTRFESFWTVPVGNSTQSFTVSPNETYYMWVDCNIPNGILVWNATATVTNTNVPVVGAQYAWVYNGGGTPIDFTSIPNQFVGTSNTIVRSNVAPSATTNRFDFGINNTSGSAQTVRYGWIQIS